LDMSAGEKVLEVLQDKVAEEVNEVVLGPTRRILPLQGRVLRERADGDLESVVVVKRDRVFGVRHNSAQGGQDGHLHLECSCGGGVEAGCEGAEQRPLPVSLSRRDRNYG